jgi:hypothetical protein
MYREEYKSTLKSRTALAVRRCCRVLQGYSPNALTSPVLASIVRMHRRQRSDLNATTLVAIDPGGAVGLEFPEYSLLDLSISRSLMPSLS